MSTLESRSDGILGGSTIVARGDFPSVSGDNIDEVVSTYRLAFCLKLQHRPRYTWLFVSAVHLILSLETDGSVSFEACLVI